MNFFKKNKTEENSNPVFSKPEIYNPFQEKIVLEFLEKLPMTKSFLDDYVITESKSATADFIDYVISKYPHVLRLEKFLPFDLLNYVVKVNMHIAFMTPIQEEVEAYFETVSEDYALEKFDIKDDMFFKTLVMTQLENMWKELEPEQKVKVAEAAIDKANELYF